MLKRHILSMLYMVLMHWKLMWVGVTTCSKQPVLKGNCAKTAPFKDVLYGRNVLETGVWLQRIAQTSLFCKEKPMLKQHVLNIFFGCDTACTV